MANPGQLQKPTFGDCMNLPVRVVRLSSNPQEKGLYCGPQGLTLAGYPLLKETAQGFAPRNPSDLQDAFDAAYGDDPGIDSSQYAQGLSSVARSLNKGDLPLAMMGSLMLKLPDIPKRAGRVATARDHGPKQALYNEDQPRDADGRWTADAQDDFDGPSSELFESPKSPSLTFLEAGTAASAEEAPLAAFAPRVIGLIARLGLAIADAVPLALGMTLIATNGSNVREGSFPGFPDLTYRSDEGVLTISRLDAAGQIENLYHGFPDADGFYHDHQGYIIGRHVGTAVLFDDVALSELISKPEPETDGDLIGLPPDVDVGNKPKICPDPTPENIKGRSNRSLAYQSQITGLPRGFDVLYNGVRFDGCNEDNGRMIEAKGLGMDWMLNWPYEKLIQSKFYIRMMRQAARQNNASAGRGDDYYFADERLEQFFGAEFGLRGYTNIVVHHVEAVVKKILEWAAWANRYLAVRASSRIMKGL
jgi:hypothetical protein